MSEVFSKSLVVLWGVSLVHMQCLIKKGVEVNLSQLSEICHMDI